MEENDKLEINVKHSKNKEKNNIKYVPNQKKLAHQK